MCILTICIGIMRLASFLNINAFLSSLFTYWTETAKVGENDTQISCLLNPKMPALAKKPETESRSPMRMKGTLFCRLSLLPPSSALARS